ncbi:NAD(P)/FAD-dependent oxidoreductase [Mesorhizobium sp. Z1-4]|uniref:NAD(P)/FAD-dependent oxidoreductase n=1 Tax=Mesorhizobium sp. Z1-4 TaxID=2448478 RepID=UPI000FDBB018|nr:NAD(P)/FAD-dependent oxidoreductase [Mesorhizobium sp. Z1-4]
MYDVLVVGGSYAGIAAALQLARARRKVAVIDAGNRRNRFASAAHGFLSRDGHTPDLIARQARRQLLAYPSVDWIEDTVSRCSGSLDAFEATTTRGEVFRGRRLILATGVNDELPEVPGLAALWGRKVFHCPYCHGYELERGSIGVLAAGEMAFHHAVVVSEWGPTTLFANGVFQPDLEQQGVFGQRGIAIEPARLAGVQDTGAGISVELETGGTVELAGLFVQARTSPACPIAEQLGCNIEESPMGTHVGTNGTQETSVPGVFAAGDTARAAGNLTFAVSDGAMAGAGAHRSLIFPPV